MQGTAAFTRHPTANPPPGMAMPRINNPTSDRDLDCEATLLERFRGLVTEALNEGWSRDEIANAMLSLSQNYRLAIEDLDTIEMHHHRANRTVQ